MREIGKVMKENEGIVIVMCEIFDEMNRNIEVYELGILKYRNDSDILQHRAIF